MRHKKARMLLACKDLWLSAKAAAKLAMVMTVQALATCAEMRPSVDISVGGDDSEEGVGVGGARTEYRSAVAA